MLNLKNIDIEPKLTIPTILLYRATVISMGSLLILQPPSVSKHGGVKPRQYNFIYLLFITIIFGSWSQYCPSGYTTLFCCSFCFYCCCCWWRRLWRRRCVAVVVIAVIVLFHVVVAIGCGGDSGK